jgi:dTMP kinase
MLVSFEGIDGVGKSTVMAEVYKRLKQDGLPVSTTRTPGGTKLGAKIREFLLDPDNAHDARADFFLFMADFLLTEASLPSGIVLTDRFKDSTLVYQLLGQNIFTPHELKALYRVLQDVGRIPDVTFVLDAPYNVACRRSLTAEFSKRDRFEDVDSDVWQKRRALYLSLPDRFPERRIFLVDTDVLSFEAVVRVISFHILTLYPDIGDM